MSTSAQTNWDDLRFVLAVADEGSVASAGRVLGVNHATVLRRIAAFETRHGLKVFEKTPTGYRVSADRRSLIEALREAGEAFGQVERLIEAERPNVSSSIRITSTDAFCHFVLGPIVAGLAAEITTSISILSSNAHLDFERLQADFSDILVPGGHIIQCGVLPEEKSETGLLGLPRLLIDFNRRDFGRLRLLIDALNA